MSWANDENTIYNMASNVWYYILLYYSLYSDIEVLYQLQSKCDLTFVMLIFYIYSNNGQYLNIIITMYSFKLWLSYLLIVIKEGY